MKTQIRYEDEHLLIVYKPAGLATQNANIRVPDMESELKKYLHGNFVGIVHRLDQPVEGLLVVAKNSTIAGLLSRELSRGNLGKEYTAAVLGPFLPEELANANNVYLQKIKKTKEGLSAIVPDSDPEGKQAHTCFSVDAYSILSEHIPINRVSIHLKTGRFHQIRCQFAANGHPLLGDQKYGNPEVNQILPGCHVALCANRIHLTHPITKKELYYEQAPQNEIFKLFE